MELTHEKEARRKGTWDSQAVMSVRQREVQTTLTLISRGWGGLTSTSSITRSFPASHATIAFHLKSNINETINTHIEKKIREKKMKNGCERIYLCRWWHWVDQWRMMMTFYFLLIISFEFISTVCFVFLVLKWRRKGRMGSSCCRWKGAVDWWVGR